MYLNAPKLKKYLFFETNSLFGKLKEIAENFSICYKF